MGVSNDLNICCFLDRSAKAHSSAIAMCCDGVYYTYAELNAHVNRLTDSLRSLGCRKGTRIAYVAGNRPEVVELFFAAARLGAVFAPISADDSSEESLRKLRILAPEVAVFDEQTIRLSAAAAKQIVSLRQILFLGSYQRRGWLTYEQLLAAGRDVYYAEPVDGNEPCLVFFTSGFTDTPKAAAFSHSSLIGYIQTAFAAADIEPDGTGLVSLPMCNIAGFISVLSTFYFHRRLVIMPQFDAAAWIRIVQDERVTRAFMPPYQLSAVLACPALNHRSLKSLMRLQYGGDSMPPALVLDALKKLPPHVKLRNVYGFTEAICKVAQLRHEDYEFDDDEDTAIKIIRLNSIGRARSGVDMIISDGKSEMPRGEIGELLVRTPYHMLGYIDPLTHEIEPCADEWLHTSDMGFMDDQGYIFLVGHKMPAFVDVQEPASAIRADSIEIFPCVVDSERLSAIPAPNDASAPLFLQILDSMRCLYQHQDLTALRRSYFDLIPELISASAYGLHLASAVESKPAEQAGDMLKWEMPTFDKLNLTVLSSAAQTDAPVKGLQVLDSITLQEMNERMAPDYWLCAPMFRADHSIIGVLSFIRCGKDWPFTSYEQGLLRILSNHMGLAISNALDHARLQERVALADEVLQIIAYGILETDVQGRVLFANRSAAQMLSDSCGGSIVQAVQHNTAVMNGKSLTSFMSRCDLHSHPDGLCVRTIRSDGGHLISLLYQSAHTPDLSSLNGLLSKREFEILTQIVEGLGNNEIARALCISENTVKYHLKSMFKKLGVCNRAELICKAYTAGREYAWHEFN